MYLAVRMRTDCQLVPSAVQTLAAAFARDSAGRADDAKARAQSMVARINSMFAENDRVLVEQKVEREHPRPRMRVARVGLRL